jgi:hypothetical protein
MERPCGRGIFLIMADEDFDNARGGSAIKGW